MKKLALLLSLTLLAPGICLAQTTGFTYQGKLSSSGAPANGDYQFEFKLFDSDVAGNQIGGTQTVVASVQNGVFTTKLDFGANSFPADADRWLESSVRPNGSTDAYTVLSPRQQLNSVPYAIRSLRSSNADNAANANNADNAATLGGVAAGNFVQTNDARLSDARPPAPGSGNYIQNSLAQQAGNFNISGNAVIGGTLTAARLNGDGSGLTNIRASFLWETVAVGAMQAQSNTGYLVTNRGQASITLPRTPVVGDVVRVSSAEAGGWKIAQNAGQSILTSNLGVVGTTWTPHANARDWTSVASSADGTKLVAVASGEPIYTSSDGGLSWIPRNSGSRNWCSVASSADGSKLVAVVGPVDGGVGALGQIYTSTDSGVTWIARENNRRWSSVASSSDGSKLVASASGGLIYTSTDSGVSWTPHATAQNWNAVASSADGTKLVAVVLRGQIYTSTNSGLSWTPHADANSWRSLASSADGTKLVAVARESGRNSAPNIYTSSDAGVSWTPRETARDWWVVASSGDGNNLIAAENGGLIYISKDAGLTWVSQESARTWSAVASSADGTRLVAAVRPGQIYTSFGSLTSVTTVGAAGDLVGGRFAAIELQYLGGGLWMPLSHEGTIVGH